MKFSNQLVLLFTALLLINCSKKEDVCHIHGTVVDTDTESVILVRPYEDLTEPAIEIPVIDGKFEYTTHIENPESYELFLSEAKENNFGPSTRIFLENTDINITVHSEENFDKNTVEGGQLNKEYKTINDEYNTKLKSLNQELTKLKEEGNYKTKAFLDADRPSLTDKNTWLKKLDSLRRLNQEYTPEGKAFNEKVSKVIESRIKWAENNPSSIVSYYLLLENVINQDIIDVNKTYKLYEKLSNNFPNHPYNEVALNLIKGKSIKAGKKFIDFTAPDLNGNPITLSTQIEGKVALLDLWATWCAPCIAKSKSMVPVYNDFKDKGFTVIGVAREKDNTEKLTKFLEKEKWPWQQLVDLDGENKIWQKYGIPNSGGEVFLIDKTGTVLAVNPTAEKVRQHLEKILN
ncbi:redoxin domain-containing protein [Flavobacterium rakeshii]|uniref:redoxin domain-containing protein n=1 Tax=Flavobacterium rakeshii TaxID=1038845 RepID=UPI002E7AB8CB|nr:redoxin domain-containing protein [Flavobacterium rakeshii]MEE1896949.1 redoxin domain-containing protein [Flavobacterium rakeshii]